MFVTRNAASPSAPQAGRRGEGLLTANRLPPDGHWPVPLRAADSASAPEILDEVVAPQLRMPFNHPHEPKQQPRVRALRRSPPRRRRTTSIHRRTRTRPLTLRPHLRPRRPPHPAQARHARPAGGRAAATHRVGHRCARRRFAVGGRSSMPYSSRRPIRGSSSTATDRPVRRRRSRGAASARTCRAISISRPQTRTRAARDLRALSRRISDELDRRRALGVPTVLISMHSFTPIYADTARPWHIGMLYNRDVRLAHVLLDLIRAEGGWVVGDNEPYSVSDGTDYAIPVHGELRGLPARRDRSPAGPRSTTRRGRANGPTACRLALRALAIVPFD